MSLISWLLGGDDIQAQSDSLDAQLAALNAKKAAEGVWTPEQYQQVLIDEAKSKQDVNGAINQGFNEGLQEGLNNELAFPGKIVGAVGSGAGTILGGILKNIPWWVWLGAAAFIAWKLGLFKKWIKA